MATRSNLNVKFSDGKVRSIYCHYDGHPSHQLPILNRYYNTQKKAEALISLGGISYLAPKIKPAKGIEHSFDSPAKDVVVAYHRDRGESLVIHCGKMCDNDYAYMFNPTKKEWELI